MTARERALSALFPPGWVVKEVAPNQFTLSVGPLTMEQTRLIAALFRLDEIENEIR
jgi:hypothetical protein